MDAIRTHLPTVAQVMARRPMTVDAHTSLFSAWGVCTADTVSTWS